MRSIGDLARLGCDRCRRVSLLFLGGARIVGAAAPLARDWLRMQCGGAGWSLLASDEDGQAVTLDLCPKCKSSLVARSSELRVASIE